MCLCRGFVYCRNEDLEPGWVVFSSGRLLHRPASFDFKPHQLCQVIDPFTLQVWQLAPSNRLHDITHDDSITLTQASTTHWVIQYCISSKRLTFLPVSGVPGRSHASPPLPRGQQHDHAAPVLRWNLPVLGVVSCQPQREDPERPLGLHGCLSAVGEDVSPSLSTMHNKALPSFPSLTPLSLLLLVQTETGLCVANVLQERVILIRKEGESSKCLNELLLSRMSRFRASHSATLAALTGSAITNTVKEEQSGNDLTLFR